MARLTSRGSLVRRPGAAALAVFVTFGLFYLMHALSAVQELIVIDHHRAPPIDLVFVPEDTEPETKVRPPARQTAEPPAPPPSRVIETVSLVTVKPVTRVEPIPAGNPGLPGKTGDRPTIRMFCPSPAYPTGPAARGIGGQVQVAFDVNRAGAVENARVVSSEPPRMFDRAALRAAGRCRFLPQTVDGEAVRTDNVPLVFSFDPTEQEEIR